MEPLAYKKNEMALRSCNPTLQTCNFLLWLAHSALNIQGLARKVAMYLCQQLGGYRLAAIRDAFGLSNVGSVSFITTQIRKRIHENPDFAETIQRMKRYVIKKAT